MNTFPTSDEKIAGRVYVVDDCDIDRHHVYRELSRTGVHVIECASADEFLDAYVGGSPASMILDIRMPGLTGLELQTLLAEKGIDLPIIVVSGVVDVPSASDAFRSGAVDVLQKPVQGELLRARVGDALRQHRQHLAEHAERSDARAKFATLTAREREVAALISQGKTVKQIAKMLQVGLQTAGKHRARVLDKMNAHTDVELAEILRNLS